MNGVLVEPEKTVGRRQTVILQETTLAVIIVSALGYLLAGLTCAHPALVPAHFFRAPTIPSPT